MINKSSNQIMSGGKAVIEKLKKENVNIVFGLIGSATMELFDALYYEKKDCCWILKEETFDQNILTTLLLNIIEDKESYLSKKKNLENFFNKNKWKNINEKIINCLNEN